MRSLLCLSVLFWIAPAAAHGVEVRILGDGAATVEFRYDDGTPLAFAEATAVAPGGGDEPAATGRTDRNGRFSFFTEQVGVWQVEVRDAAGHFAHASVNSTGGHIEVPRHAFPDWLVALSLVVNVAAAGWFGKRRSRAVQPTIREAT